MEDKLPFHVNKHIKGYEKLRNTYYITESGLLIPDTICFFRNYFAHSILFLGGFVLNFESYLKHFSQRSMLLSIASEARKGRNNIDEILAICDPKESFGLVKTGFNGCYPPDSLHFFNTPNLKTFYEKLSQKHYVDRNHFPTKEFQDLESYWNQLLYQELRYQEDLDKGLPDDVHRDAIPPKVLEMKIRFLD